jgi:micrococcal nuclease
MKALILSMMILVTAPGAMAYEEISGKVTSVIDGNTLEVRASNNQVHKVMLVGIDCPELGQEFGSQAKKFLEKIILNKEVTLEFRGKDRVGNLLAVVMIDGDVDPRVELLKEGLAWTAERNPNADLEPYRTWAEQKNKGLWVRENPTPPWTYRRQQTMMQPKSS